MTPRHVAASHTGRLIRPLIPIMQRVMASLLP